ncbi:MAG: H4MPT-linked C1 transfer pathway protein [Planctomycetaceae bacterium]|nr:H4MPT-linked C1 transfer pathway protein [Planctomycetaceae bacterium]MBP61758.1 H4MPT-linked C1 transfer pathway protein [Planctomycetaceae bacterium]
MSVDATLRYKFLVAVEGFESNCRRLLWIALVSVLALDIGGANIKAADGLEYLTLVPFALWKEPQCLALKLRQIISAAPPHELLAVTMTGELVDCFETKADGVRFILDAVEQACRTRVCVYLADGSYRSVEEARQHPYLTAASNWHALARFCCRFVSRGSAILVDIGSTTCDVIPLNSEKVLAQGTTDTERLLYHELVYTGVQRTPICGITDSVTYHGQRCAIANEWFATSWDVYLMLGQLPEQPDRCDTADGRPATKAASHRRLARVICADVNSFSPDDAKQMARELAARQACQVGLAIQKVRERCGNQVTACILSGSGEFLARQAIRVLGHQSILIRWEEKVGSRVSPCATAYALAVLTRESVKT